ncbi:hypothetical protein BX600DRAFT_505111 [Xylariales sp. PMI_506]|nr:hypothetical protein BX600DRAFT_505111 [Xylariales sp. PMI_506]
MRTPPRKWVLKLLYTYLLKHNSSTSNSSATQPFAARVVTFAASNPWPTENRQFARGHVGNCESTYFQDGMTRPLESESQGYFRQHTVVMPERQSWDPSFATPVDLSIPPRPGSFHHKYSTVHGLTVCNYRTTQGFPARTFTFGGLLGTTTTVIERPPS